MRKPHIWNSSRTNPLKENDPLEAQSRRHLRDNDKRSPFPAPPPQSQSGGKETRKVSMADTATKARVLSESGVGSTLYQLCDPEQVP